MQTKSEKTNRPKTVASPCKAPRWAGRGIVEENRQIADHTWQIAIQTDDFAKRVCPGQFVMLRLANQNDPLLGRPFAVYDADPVSGRIVVIYITVGKMTHRLTEVRSNDTLELWGPLGNGWGVVPGLEEAAASLFSESVVSSACLKEETPNHLLRPQHLILVAGGIGQTPFLMLAKRFLALEPESQLSASIPPVADAATKILPVNDAATKILTPNDAEEKAVPAKVTLLLGAKTASRLCCVDDFSRLGVTVNIATEDGSQGTKGYVTDLLPSLLERSELPLDRILLLGCGPKPMLKSTAALAQKYDVPCWTSLESGMACGLGICYSCVIEYLDDQGNWDYRRTCYDGPVFNASRLKWD